MNELFMSLDWRQPLWLLLAFQPIMLWLVLRYLKNRNQQHFADEALLPWVEVQYQRSFLQKLFSRDTAYMLAWLGFAIALAGPRLPQKNNPDPSQTQLDVMLVIDLSRSMNAKDIKPSRIRRATLEAYEFLSMVKSARVGVVVYAARPHLYTPLTNDFKALEFYLKDLDSLQLPTQGGDAVAALTFAETELLSNTTSNQSINIDINKAIVWLTDGDFDASQIAQFEKSLKTPSTSIHILGLGTADGAAIPLKDGSWFESNGQTVITKANFDFLSKTAQKWGGVFSLASDDESDWQAIYQKGILSQLKPASSNDTENREELYPWFLFTAILLLGIALFPSLKALLLVLGISLMIGLLSTANAEDNFSENILEGAGNYENEDFSLAKAEFIQAVLKANSGKERAMAMHNLGNSLFKIGDYETALFLYSDALRYDPNQINTLYNHKLTFELYKLLQKRQQRILLRGPVTTPSSEQNIFDLPEQIAFMLENKIHTMDFKLPELPQDEKNRLIGKGLAHLQLIESEQLQNQEQGLQRQKINQAKLYLNSLEEQNTESSSALWKRLFEIEEGFAAEVDEPKSIPGVRPW
jgi:Ca-activated chloride channel family protein